MKKIIIGVLIILSCGLLVSSYFLFFRDKAPTEPIVNTINLQGKVENINDGGVKNVSVSINGTTGLTAADGTFSIDIPETSEDFTVILSKNTFHTATYNFSNEIRNFGTLNLSYSASSSIFKIGGERDINSFNLQFFRTLTGIRIEGVTFQEFNSPENWIELVISTDPTHIIRSSTEVQILLKGDGTYVVKNFADGNFPTTGLTYSINKTSVGTGVVLEIPYEWLGISVSDVIAFAGGVRALTSEGVEDWSGLIFEKLEINPEKPTTYVRFDKNNRLYSQSNEGIFITVSGVVSNDLGEKLKDVSVFIDGELVSSSDENGAYTFTITKPFGDFEVGFSKSGYVYNSFMAKISDFPMNGSSMEYETTLSEGQTENLVYISGTVKNIIEGELEGVVVFSGNYSTLTDEEGNFSLGLVQNEENLYEVTVYKTGYAKETHLLNADSENSFGVLNISYETHPVPYVVGGANSTYQFIITFTRNLDGVLVTGKTSQQFDSNSHWVELLVSTKEPLNNKSANDIQFFLYGDGTYSVSSLGIFSPEGVSYKTYKEGNSHYFELLMPYNWLNILPQEIIGFAGGSAYNLEEEGQIAWDGTAFEGSVEALSPITYVRFGKNNELYRGLENEPLVTLQGIITDAEGNPIEGVYISRGSTLLGRTDSNGEYMFSIAKPLIEYEMTYIKAGYKEFSQTIAGDDFISGVCEIDIQLEIDDSLGANVDFDLDNYKFVAHFGSPAIFANVKRDETAIYFAFETDAGALDNVAQNGLWIFISTDEPTSSRHTDTNAYSFMITGNTEEDIIVTSASGNTNVSRIKVSFQEEGDTLIVVLVIPYKFFNEKAGASIDATSIIGVSFATEIVEGNFKYGFDYNDGNYGEYKNVDDPTTYLRIDEECNLFNNNKNEKIVVEEE